jgi:hypothetical protein
MINTIKKFLFTSMLATACPILAQDDLCNEFLEIERETNKQLPRKTDAVTEVIQVRTNCQLKIISFIMRLTVDENELASGWRERKARQHQQLHCNLNGLASTARWTARTVLHSANFLNNLAEFVTRPTDCE